MNWLTKDIPGNIWTIISLLAITWHLGTEYPYADRNLLSEQLANYVTNSNDYWQLRWLKAYRKVNPPKPCICEISVHKILIVRKQALDMEKQARELKK